MGAGFLAALLVPASGLARELGVASSHWAWSPLEEPALPTLVTSRAKTPVDHFTFSRLSESGVEPAPEASPRELLRRVHLDLTGLPPTPAETEAFLRDPGDEAYARIVDDLLGRPQYGERWGRHWLDLARYGDSNGGDEKHSDPAWGPG